MVVFTRRYIVVTFTGKTTVKVDKGHRISARINQPGGPGMATAEIEIYGLPLSVTNELSTWGTKYHPSYDYQVTVEAGDDVNGMSKVFTGNVTSAWADMRAMPNVPFRVISQAGGTAAVQTDVPPTSHSGSVDVAKMMEDLAKKMHMEFENRGVNKKIADPYFYGAPRQQVWEIAAAAGIGWAIENNKLIIFPWDKSTGGGMLVSPQTGLVAYPIFTEYGVEVKTEFKRSVDYMSSFTVQSDIKPANGEWMVVRLDYDLQAFFPKGHWFLTLGGMRAPGAGGFIQR